LRSDQKIKSLLSLGFNFNPVTCDPISCPLKTIFYSVCDNRRRLISEFNKALIMSEKGNFPAGKMKLQHIGENFETFSENVASSIKMMAKHFDAATLTHKTEKGKEIANQKTESSLWQNFKFGENEITVDRETEFENNLGWILNKKFDDIKLAVRKDQPWDAVLQNMIFDGFYR